MCAEEGIKNQMVDSHQSKAWHTANSLRNSSPSFPHKYLPCVTALSETPNLPLWLAAGNHVLLSHPDLPLPHINSQEPTMSLAWPGLCPALVEHHPFFWAVQPWMCSRPRDRPGFPFAQLSAVQRGMTKISVPFSMHTVLSNRKGKKGVCILLSLVHLGPLL